MNLGIFLGVGESLGQMEKSGQKDRFVNQYLKTYAKEFDKVYLFSYGNETYDLPKNITLVPNKSGLHRYLYALLLPFTSSKQVADCDVIRGFGLASAVSSFLLTKPFVFNWAYDYQQFIKLQNKTFYSPVYFILEKFAFAKAKKVFIATKSKFDKLNGSKYIYLPNGVDLKIFKPIKPNGEGLVFVGRFEKQKNLFCLIDAISALSQGDRAITFVGSGSQENELKKYAREKGVSLKILSPVANNQLPKILSQYSIFTLPSFSEGSPKVLLEAMAAGLAPVVTSFATAGDIVQDGINGCITGYDVEEYSAKLELLLKDAGLIKKIQDNARQTIIKNFNFENLIAEEIKILKEAAS